MKTTFGLAEYSLVIGTCRSRLEKILRIGFCAVAVLTACAMTVLSASKAVGQERSESESKNNEDASPAISAVDRQWQTNGWGLLEQFCLDCHNDAFQEAELDLSGFKTVEGLMTEGNGMLAERVLNMVRFGAMPPEDYDLPTDAERKQLVEALDAAIFSVVCDLRPKPGKITARRLNKAEYNHSIRDLFGMDLRPADAFPSDEVGGGFDNNGDVLSLSSMLIEKYLAAAESVAEQVIVDPEDLPSLSAERAGDGLIAVGDHKNGSFFGRFLSPDAFVWTEFDVPVAGTYRIEIAAGNTLDDAGTARFGLVDESGLLLNVFELEHFGGSGRSQRTRETVHFDAGKRRIAVAPLSDDQSWEPMKSVFKPFAEMSDEQIKTGRDGVGKALVVTRRFEKDEYPFMVRKIEIDGPKERDVEVFPPSQWTIVRSQPERRRDSYKNVEQAAEKCLRPLMRRAFRGPIADEDLQPYVDLVKASTDRGDSFFDGLQVAVSAVLVSPRFLFRVETPAAGTTLDAEEMDQGVARLTDHQLATRLSYFLWSSLPDDRLLDLADKGKLSKDSVLRGEVERMIADPKSESLATQFAAQWLGLRNLQSAQPDTERFDSFSLDLLPKMSRETELLFLHMVRHNRPVSELLTADYTFLDASLAKYYGIEDFAGDDFQRVDLTMTPRRGVLSHASVLTLTSQPTRTSPVKRGKWILENILGTPPPEPPPGVPELEESEVAAADASFREQLELHRSDPSCAACHRVMDQLGFGLEEFDAVGRYREMDGKFPIDASGEMPGGRSFVGASDLTRVLGESEQTAFAQTVAKRLLAFALGRELTPDDRCVIDEMVSKSSKKDYRFKDLITEVVLSRPFQYYQWSQPES